MPSPEILPFAKLLAPIAGEKPAGEDLRASSGPGSLYYAVKDARTAARAAERQIENGDAEAAPPDWKPVVTNAITAISEKSKDLELTAYLIEALTRLNGFAGMRDGFRLARELVEKFWANLYPMPDEEGIDTRVAPLTGLNGDDAEGTLIAPINRIALTESATFGGLSHASYLLAVATGKILDPKVKEKKIAAGAMTMETIQKAVEETPAKFYKTLLEDLNQCMEEFGKLTAACEPKCAGRAPPSTAIRNALTHVQDAIKDIARAKIEIPAAAAPPGDKKEAKDGKPAADESDGPGEKLGVLRNRDDALNSLSRVAEYFRRTEPHTPLSYALEQVVRWGRMPLPELLAELIPEEASRKSFFKQVGIRPPEPAKPEKAEKK